MGLSIRAYAQHRGVSHTAVAKAVSAGRISKKADGTIDPATADAQWDRNTLPSQSLNTTAGKAAAKVETSRVETWVETGNLFLSLTLGKRRASRGPRAQNRQGGPTMPARDAIDAWVMFSLCLNRQTAHRTFWRVLRLSTFSAPTRSKDLKSPSESHNI